ncbi:MAG TPA: hypothetical protein VFX84_04025 [Candidatus Saccharimonadales bacterium]|nr:hypothetical protein [Candidatus Saccharimonadales bacterium]
MRQVATAEALMSMRVCVPDEGKVEGRVQDVPYRTELFRRDARQAETLDFILGRIPRDSGLSAVIAGCSIGAEADSLLSLYDRSGREGRAEVVGLDASRTAVEAARRGLYRLYNHIIFGSEEDVAGKRVLDEEEFLADMGFTTSREHNEHPTFSAASIIVDAAPVRQGHAVRFVAHDAAEPLPVSGEVDLAQASNLLYHLDADRAIRIARNMADILADRGVLSFGSVGSYYFNKETKAPMEAALYDDFGLEPVAIATEDLMIYARP